MNILIVANHFAVCSARYAADAFARLGHKVRHVGRPMGRDIWGMQVPQEYVWEPDDIPSFRDGWADLIIVMDSDPAMLDYPLNDTGGRRFPGVPAVVWGVDNHCRDYRRDHFDHYFLAHKSVSVMEWEYEVTEDAGDAVYSDVLDYEDMTWLPCAYDPVAFPPSPIPWEQREYDVCMIGVMYPKRWELVNAMRAAGLNVLAGTGLVYDAYRDAHHNSRVALVSSFNGDLPIRLFEALGLGCAVIHDPICDIALLDDAPPAAFAQEYTTVEHAVRLAKEAQEWWGVGVSNTSARVEQWAASHTWEKRAQVMIDWLEARS